MAASADLRIATPSARFGVPIARTLGNCLSGDVYALLADSFGTARTLDILLRARLVDAQEAVTAGFVGQVCEEDALDEAVAETVRTLLGHAPLSMWAAKRAITRLRRAAVSGVETDYIVAKVYGSRDFQQAVAGFGSGAPSWTGE
jgi:enoyl-CoA hydratase/carnithine racemase